MSSDLVPESSCYGTADNAVGLRSHHGCIDSAFRIARIGITWAYAFAPRTERSEIRCNHPIFMKRIRKRIILESLFNTPSRCYCCKVFLLYHILLLLLHERIICLLRSRNQNKAFREVVEAVYDTTFPFVITMTADDFRKICGGNRKERSAIDGILQWHCWYTALLPVNEGIRALENKLSCHFYQLYVQGRGRC